MGVPTKAEPKTPAALNILSLIHIYVETPGGTLIGRVFLTNGKANDLTTVSYTHLDVYKRQGGRRVPFAR